jgi:hypothetical protein
MSFPLELKRMIVLETKVVVFPLPSSRSLLIREWYVCCRHEFLLCLSLSWHMRRVEKKGKSKDNNNLWVRTFSLLLPVDCETDGLVGTCRRSLISVCQVVNRPRKTDRQFEVERDDYRCSRVESSTHVVHLPSICLFRCVRWHNHAGVY